MEVIHQQFGHLLAWSFLLDFVQVRSKHASSCFPFIHSFIYSYSMHIADNNNDDHGVVIIEIT